MAKKKHEILFDIIYDKIENSVGVNNTYDVLDNFNYFENIKLSELPGDYTVKDLVRAVARSMEEYDGAMVILVPDLETQEDREPDCFNIVDNETVFSGRFVSNKEVSEIVNILYDYYIDDGTM